MKAGLIGDIELRESCSGLEWRDGQADGFELRAHLHWDVTKLAAVLPEQVQVSGVTVRSMEPGQDPTPAQGPWWFHSSESDPLRYREGRHGGWRNRWLVHLRDRWPGARRPKRRNIMNGTTSAARLCALLAFFLLDCTMDTCS